MIADQACGNVYVYIPLQKIVGDLAMLKGGGTKRFKCCFNAVPLRVINLFIPADALPSIARHDVMPGGTPPLNTQCVSRHTEISNE